MATEEMIRGNPIDGVVLLGGCDKTIPSLLMGATSVNLPAIIVPGGPMLNGTFKGKMLGCGTDVWRFSADVRSGKMSEEDFNASERSMIRSNGNSINDGMHCRSARNDAPWISRNTSGR
jgi:dihydroxy-acid dehydratase